MKISEQYPPNYTQILIAFPDLEKHKPIFTYGDTIYNPFKVEITPDLEAHEAVHTKQQGTFPEVWWNEYINNLDFRFSQELEAYGTQLIFLESIITDSKLMEWFWDKITSALSGELYGNMLNYGQAKSKLRHFVKKNKLENEKN